MKSLLGFLLRMALLAAFTFAFIVLFEHGPQDFVEGAKVEWNLLFNAKQDGAEIHASPQKNGG